MKKMLKIMLMAVVLMWGRVAWANLYLVENVPVSAESSSALAAKEAALAAGQVVAFGRLIARLSPENEGQLPPMTEEEVLPYVLGVSIENEKTTATKYMGSIAVEFNPVAVKAFLNAQQMTYLRTAPPSLLVIPEYVVGGSVQTLEESNPLYQALKEKGNFAPFYQAVVPDGTPEELALVRQEVGAATDLLSTYRKDKVMVLHLEFEGEDTWKIYSSFYPSAGMQNQVVYKRFRYGMSDSKQAAAQMAASVFQEMERRWREDRTSSLDDKQTLYLRVRVNSLAEWLALEKEMKTWNFFENLTLKGVYLPQVLVEATYKGNEDKIQSDLLNHGWQLTRDFSGNGATLTKVNTYEE